MSYDEINSILMGAGGRSASFREHGDRVWGTVVGEVQHKQQIDFDTEQPKTWDDGNPQMQLVITLQTDLQEDSEDDGLRKVYVKIPSQLQSAMRKAILKAGATGILEGGKFLVQYISDAEPAKRGRHGAKQYFCKYEPPAAQWMAPDAGDEEVPPPDDESMPF
jgi:hypothetical protein